MLLAMMKQQGLDLASSVCNEIRKQEKYVKHPFPVIRQTTEGKQAR